MQALDEMKKCTRKDVENRNISFIGDATEPHALQMHRAMLCRIWDDDGNAFIDNPPFMRKHTFQWHLLLCMTEVEILFKFCNGKFGIEN